MNNLFDESSMALLCDGVLKEAIYKHPDWKMEDLEKDLFISWWLKKVNWFKYKVIWNPLLSIVKMTEKEAKYYKRIYPLWFISSNSPVKETIFYNLPQSISRKIIMEYL